MEGKITLSSSDDMSESNLRRLEKTLGNIINASNNVSASHGNNVDFRRISRLLDSTISIAYTPRNSSSHRLTACNVLCGLVELCAESDNKQINELVCADQFYTALLDLYLDRYDISKGKSMIRLLGTILRTFKDGELSYDSVDRLLKRPFDILIQSHDHIRAKPALILLSSLLSKGFLTISGLLDSFDVKRRDTNIDTESLQLPHGLQGLIKLLLNWMFYPDLALAVGQFISTLLAFEDGSSDNTSNGDEILEGKDLPIWTVPVMEAVARRPEDLRLLKVYLFPAIFRIDIKGFWAFLKSLNVDAYISPTETDLNTIPNSNRISLENKELLLFSALQAGKAMSLIRESGTIKNIEVRSNTIWIPDYFLGSLLRHSSSEVRLAGLSLLTTSAYATRPLTPGALKILERCLPAIFAEVDPNIRSEALNLIQSLVDRLRAITFNLSHKVHRGTVFRPVMENGSIHGGCQDESLHYNDRITFAAHEEFLRWFSKFLTSDLLPTASYQRHISALKSLKILLRSGIDSSVPEQLLSKQASLDVVWPFHLAIIDHETTRLLYDLLLDPFDDVRQNAVALLQLSFTRSGNDHVSSTRRTLKRASTLMLDTGRLDHADGVARIYSLLCFCLSGHGLTTENRSVSSNPGQQWQQSYYDVLEEIISLIEKGIETSKTSFALAVSSYPMHGLFTGLKYSLEQAPRKGTLSAGDNDRIANLIDRVCDTLVGIWHTVQDVLCNDAPEGFMPDEMEGEADLTTKDVLSYSWRALKDASLLLRLIVTSDLVLVSATAALQDRLKVLGDLCFEQLAELRHRGAFSSVAQTFIALCQRCIADPESRTGDLVQGWYHRILSLVKEKGSTTTRRSAGIPALMVAVLSANPSSGLFEEAIIDLKTLSTLKSDLIANDELPQVHALNCLKAIFTSTKLSSRSDRYIAGVLDVAAKALGSTIWAIRNCGLMLFRSLVDRLIGPNETRRACSPDTSLISWDRYPGLVDSLLGLLRNMQNSISPGSDVGAEAVFLVLDIFRRTPGPAQYRNEVRTLVLEASSSSHWHVRHIAAQAFAASTQPESAIDDVKLLLAFDQCTDNMLHGRLLCVSYITGILLESLKTREHGYEQLDELIQVLSATELSKRTSNGFVLAPLADSINAIGKRSLMNLHIGLEPPSNVTEHLVGALLLPERLYLDNPRLRDDPNLKKSIAVGMILAHIVATPVDDGRKWIASPPEERISLVLDAQDRDATDLVIDTIGKMLPKFSTPRYLPFVEALAKFVISSTSTPDQSVVATRTLATILDGLDTYETGYRYFNIRSMLSEFDARLYFFQSASPAVAEGNLRLWSHCLCARRIIEKTWNVDSLSREMRIFIEAGHCALDEWNEFNMRLAGVQSLRTLARIVRLEPSWPEDMEVAFYFTIYEALVDDDDDIRTLASEAVTTSLSHAKSANPPAACQMVYKHLVRRHSKSNAVLTRTIAKITATEQTNIHSALEPTVYHQLQEFLRPDNSLFAIEKPNLHLDPTKDAEMWSQVLKRLDVTSAPPAMLNAFAQWVMDGLKTLRDQADTAVDGPLGWTSKPDVFTLDMRVIFAADVLLEWRRRTPKVKTRGSEIRKALAELAERGRANSLHEFWLRKIEAVISRSVVLKVKRVNAVLAALPVRQEDA